MHGQQNIRNTPGIINGRSLVRSQLVSAEFPSDRTMDLELTQPLTEMSSRSIS